jgi:L-alanine-DL-glutamate epimerase-like enolase superfamily enzyme
LSRPFTIARGTRETITNVFVELERDGITGYGEAAPNRRYDEDVRMVTNYLDNVNLKALPGISNPILIKNPIEGPEKQVKSARCAVEMAYLDWYGKATETPIFQYLGSETRTGVVSSFTLGMDDPKVLPEKVDEAASYPLLKVKLGGKHDRELIRLLKKLVNKPLFIDVNEGWQNLDEACTMIDMLDGLDIRLLEQPMPAEHASEELIRLKNYSPFPICADEGFVGDESLELISDKYDCINIKLMKTGSILKSLSIIEQAHEIGLKVMVGCMVESSVADTASALLSLWSDFADIDGRLLIDTDPFQGVELNDDARLVLPDKPGLGISPRQTWKSCCL